MPSPAPSTPAPRDLPNAAHCAVRLRAAVTQLSRRLRPAPQDGGISVAKLSVIGRLYRGGPLTPTGIAHGEGVKLQSLTRLLAELEADGWLAREPDAADGRRTRLSLTKLGARRLTASVQAGEASLADVIASEFDATARRRLLEACTLLDEVADALEARTQAIASRPLATAMPASRPKKRAVR